MHLGGEVVEDVAGSWCGGGGGGVVGHLGVGVGKVDRFCLGRLDLSGGDWNED